MRGGQVKKDALCALYENSAHAKEVIGPLNITLYKVATPWKIPVSAPDLKYTNTIRLI